MSEPEEIAEQLDPTPGGIRERYVNDARADALERHKKLDPDGRQSFKLLRRILDKKKKASK